MQIDVVRPEELTSEQILAWTGFQKAGPDLVSPFLSPHWPRAVERARQGTRTRTLVAVAHENGAPKAFLPAGVKGGVAAAAGAPMCDYQGLIAAPGARVETARLLRALGAGRYDFTHMPKSQSAFAGHVRGLEPSWIARLPFGYDAYAHDKSAESGVLKDLDKRRRKLTREHAEPVFTAFSRSRSDLDQLIEWKRAQYRCTGQTDIFEAGWTRELLSDLFESRDPDFGGALFTLHVGETLAAAHFHLRGGDVIHAWMICHDDDFERYSPGLLLFQDIMRWMDDTPYTSIDFGPGEYRFKRQLSNAECLMGHGFVGRPGASALVRSAAYGIRETAERLPLGKVSALPGKAMRRYDLIRALR